MPNADPRQARHDQRWIEAYNDGSYDIPPYGVCEYTDSLFPDKANKHTRQVLEVRRPSADNLTTVCVNGPGRIRKGGYGQVTLDYPTYALYTYSLATDETPEVGDEWGTEAKKFTLKKGNTGFQIIGGVVNNGASAAVRVERKSGGLPWYHVYSVIGVTLTGTKQKVPFRQDYPLYLETTGHDFNLINDEVKVNASGVYLLTATVLFYIAGGAAPNPEYPAQIFGEVYSSSTQNAFLTASPTSGMSYIDIAMAPNGEGFMTAGITTIIPISTVPFYIGVTARMNTDPGWHSTGSFVSKSSMVLSCLQKGISE